MHIRSRLRLAALVAAGMLCAAVGTAHANRGQVVNGEANYLTKWGPIEITMGEFVVRCNLVLEGSFAATTFAKRAGTTISRIEEASFEGCSGGRASVLTATLPWTTTYSSFSGTLPRITGISVSLVGAGASIEPTGFGASCLLRTETGAPAKGTATTTAEAGGLLEIPTVRADETVRFTLSGSGLCGLTSATLRGSGGELSGRREITAVKLI